MRPRNSARLSESMLKDAILDVSERRPRVDHVVGDAILQTLANDSSEIHLIEPFQMFHIVTTKGSPLGSLQKGWKNHGPEDHDFCSYGEAVIADDRTENEPLWSCCQVLVRRSEDAIKIEKFVHDFYWPSVDVDANALFCLSGSRLGEDLFVFDIGIHP